MANNSNKDPLYTQANAISTAQTQGSVTHTMVGGLFHDIIDWLNNKPGGIVYPSPSGNDTYLHWNGSDYNWTTPSGGGTQLNVPLTYFNTGSIGAAPGNGYALGYDNGAYKWIQAGGGTGGGLSWTDLANSGSEPINQTHISNAFGTLIKTYKFWGNQFGTANNNTNVELKGQIEANYGIKIGSAYITWDSEHSALKVSGANNASMNFYATGGVSALGYDASGGGGGGGGLTPGNWAEYFNGKPTNDLDVTNGYLGKTGDKVSWISGSPSGGLNSPLQEINNSNLGTHDSTKGSKQILVWNSSSINPNGVWTFENMPEGGQGGGGTVTSVGLQMPSGFSVSGSPITDRGTFNVGFSNGYSLVDSGDRANWNGKLNETTYNDFINNTTWWGQKITNGVVQGDMEAGTAGGAITGFHSLELNTHNTDSNHGGFIDFHYKGYLTSDETKPKPDYTARIIEDSLGILHIESMEKTTAEKLQRAGLHVGQNFKDSFVQIGNVKLVYDGDSAIRVEKYDGTAAHFYATGGISALGIQPEVTGMEDFTISRLHSSTVYIEGRNATWNSIWDNTDDGVSNPQFILETNNTQIKFKVKDGTEASQQAAVIKKDGIQVGDESNSGKFYFDSNHYLFLDNGVLKYYNGSQPKTVKFVED